MYYKRRYDRFHRVLRVGECCRKNGTYVYRWTDLWGKRHQVYARDLDTLRVKEEKIELNRLEGIKEPPSTLTVEVLFESWIKLKRGIKGSTRSGYIYTFDTFVRSSFGKKRVIQVKRSDVRAFYIYLLEERGLAIGTVENVHTVLRQVFQFAVDDDYLRKNPCDQILKEIKLSSNNLKRMRRKALTLRQEVSFLKFLADNDRYQHWYPTFFIMANTGMRVGELAGLRWCDVDLQNLRIDINHALVYYDRRDGSGAHFVISTPKTENGRRTIFITEAVRDAFLMEKEYQELAGIKSLSEVDGYKDFIFVNYKGRVQNQGALNKALYSIIRDHNAATTDSINIGQKELLPHFSCHVLRHTYATRLMEAGVNIKFVQSQMGHSEIQTTLDIYVTPSDEFKRMQIAPFEDYMNSALGDRKTDSPESDNAIS